ncbi:MAG: hypothetical protein MZU84_06945 [Sphingobacterium sp.]|nr:hypothetical protein [Sphingobacterium sp.]
MDDSLDFLAECGLCRAEAQPAPVSGENARPARADRPLPTPQRHCGQRPPGQRGLRHHRHRRARRKARRQRRDHRPA